MKKIVMMLFTAVLLAVACFAGSSEAFAMTSKGAIQFKTDANTYSKHATSIVVTGTLARDLDNGYTVFLYKKGKTAPVKMIDVDHSIGTRSFRAVFSTKNIPAGKYDVIVAQSWAWKNWHGELKHYITVQH
ncbi:hypothetical protein OZL92_15635 [Bacillus sonorensis]|uniref:Protein YobA n=2 Tax=Bacillus sonorensis TaxID=119858 RepID=M5PC97_9BACI|nr:MULTISPECIES: hypothetical protein [Bacillus]TWK73946.1 hypothetical protein CHCC20335_2231 [Bacillus paralicheniformis]ASB91245.1 hypothetical protein S101395_04757 [Bacillus sonorensis]EME72712.1 hypothetical protein BSONL12_20625 [Bacillus sonorensis L12]MBG9917401.1 hypothetical protein [Bacillus sonorensis]MCF7620029.1 hypothetical protein [Bacillus sonorensis]